MKDTTAIGSTTEGMVLAALLRKGKKVLLPFNGASRYDLLLDEDGKFIRVQCKTGRVRNGFVVFNNYSVTSAGSKYYTKDEIDSFGVYCPDNETTYFVPIDTCNKGKNRLRLDGANRAAGRSAKDFEF